jgi:hypothetical protein
MPDSAVLELASTGRARCRACGQAIVKGAVRLGERVPNPFAEGEDAVTTHWYHPVCGAFRRPEALIAALAQPAIEVADRDHLAVEAALGVAHHRAVRVDTAGRAPSGRATCRACRELIAKDTWRIGLVFYEDGRFAPAGYVHASCARAYFETPALIPRIRHFSPDLCDADVSELTTLLGAM